MEAAFLTTQADSGVVTSAANFKREFPISLVVVPVLGPVEHNELRRERSTVVDGLSTHRASRHFRSYWHYTCFSGFDPPLMAQGSQAIRESSSVPGEGNSLGR